MELRSVSVTFTNNIVEFLGGNLVQVIVLVVCPLSTAMLGLATIRNVRPRFAIAGLGFLLTLAALLA